MKNPMKRRLVICSAVLLVLALVTVLGLTLSQNLNMTRKKEAEYILNSYADNLMLRFKGELNETGVLAQIADIMEGDDDSWFDSAAAPLLRRKRSSLCLPDSRGYYRPCAAQRGLWLSGRARSERLFLYLYHGKGSEGPGDRGACHDRRG